MSDDIVDRLREHSDQIARLYGEPASSEDGLRPADELRFIYHEAVGAILHLRAVLDAIDALHQSTAAETPPFLWCNECVLPWPCDTHLLIQPKKTNDE
jgi:hypothetical protein